ncbi:MAG: hypothetical protein V3W41_08400 [Planctomycetota bacterium]
MGIAALAMTTQAIATIPRPNPKAPLEGVFEVVWRDVWSKATSRLQGRSDMQHRITLFELRKFWLPPWLRRGKARNCTHKLVPRLRWPLDAPAPRRVWYVNEYDDRECEGVVGQAYCRGLEAVTNLPGLSDDSAPVNFAVYAEKAYDSEENIKEYHYAARSIGGGTIQVHGERWGVLVLDSVDPEGVTIGKLEDRSGGFHRAQRLTTKILEAQK